MALDYTDIIKNNELIRGIFSLYETDSTDRHEEFFSPTTSTSIDKGLDFMLSHFDEPDWKRKLDLVYNKISIH